MQMNTIIYPDLSYQLNGILFRIHNNIGRFLNEKQYCDAIEQELKKEKIPYRRELVLQATFDGERAGRNRVDFLIDDKIILEVKAKRLIERDDYYQAKRYLGSLNTKLAVIVNFREKSLNLRRVLNSAAQIG